MIYISPDASLNANLVTFHSNFATGLDVAAAPQGPPQRRSHPRRRAVPTRARAPRRPSDAAAGIGISGIDGDDLSIDAGAAQVSS
jgi:hypothetical protein